jgi:hypothetical protein
VEVFSKIRYNDAPGSKEPLGVVVTVQVTLLNASDLPVHIFWKLTGAGTESTILSNEWVQGLPAYELNATDDVDQGTFSLWVPLPTEKGDYAVSVSARTSDKALPNATIVSSVIH